MKKVCTLVLLFFFALPIFAQDVEDASDSKNVIKANTLSLIFGVGSIFYERELSDNLSGQLGAAYLSYKFDETKFSGFILTPEVRFYIKKNAIDGFYIAPYGRFQNFKLESGADDATYTNIGGGLLFGRQWIFKKGFVIDFFFGGHYGSGNLKVDSGTEDSFSTSTFEGIRPRLGLALGFAF